MIDGLRPGRGQEQGCCGSAIRGRGASLGWVPKFGIGAWTFIGFVAATAIVVAALAAVSEIVLPLTFAAVLAVVFQPLVASLERHKMKATYAAGLIVPRAVGRLLLTSCRPRPAHRETHAGLTSA